MVYEPSFSSKKGKERRPFYNLMMFPYPSAEGLHVGNMYAFTGSDIYGRLKRMQGYDVFEPIGLDGFGIHSENYALKIGKHPAVQAKISQKNFYRQLTEIGNGFAWNERLETYDPEYYRWTQWIFAQMFRNGLAYRKKQAVNWCPSCMTVLADEQVIKDSKLNNQDSKQTDENVRGGYVGVGLCERCDSEVQKKELEQWFFKITDYAEKLLNGLDDIDWAQKIKLAQKHWIGRSDGASFKFKFADSDFKISDFIEVFTTRPDTIFGVTFLVVSPETALGWVLDGWSPRDEVKKYLSETHGGEQKSGVFSDLYVINPATEQKIPVWISNYVLYEYGTGAIMAVPAHDERDLEFARQFDLPIRQVISKKDAPIKSYLMGAEDIEDSDLTDIGITISGRTSSGIRKLIIPHDKTHAYESLLIKKLSPGFWNEYVGPETVFIFKHKDGVVERIELDHRTEAKIAKLAKEFMGADWSHTNQSVWRWLYENKWYSDLISHSDSGMLVNSGRFNGADSEIERWNVADFAGGEKRVQYRLRDWLISRQRYWGPPIPMIFCKSCEGNNVGERRDMPGWHTVPDSDLPIVLPRVKDFRPQGTGESPLASAVSWVKVPCPHCGGDAKRETDVSDTFLDSAWYYIGYLAKLNAKGKKTKKAQNPFLNPLINSWLPVDMYIGGAEHAVLHLLYVRFLSYVLHDWGFTQFHEPAKMFRAHGLLIRDGKKISKSKGNIINPDQFITKFGADAFRMHLMFLGPFEDGGDFRDAGIAGPVRFLERVWAVGSTIIGSNKEKKKAKKEKESDVMGPKIHKAIKKVTEDIESLRYNTAISTLMVLIKSFESDTPTKAEFLAFIKLLAPFAPFMTEELWQNLSKSKSKSFQSIHLSEWPKYDESLMQEDVIDLIVQVNGKLRGTISVSRYIGEDEAIALAMALPKIDSFIGQNPPKRTVYVPGRLVNFVV